jgi:hypothetical protein
MPPGPGNEPSKVGSSEAWSNPQTKSSGTYTVLRVFHSSGMVCHLVRHQIVVAGQPPVTSTALPGAVRRPGNGRSRASPPMRPVAAHRHAGRPVGAVEGAR